MVECKFTDDSKSKNKLEFVSCPNEATRKYMGWECCQKHYEILRNQ